MITALHRWYSDRARLRRGRLFQERLRPTPDDTILDLGGGDGSHIAALCDWTKNITVADASAPDLAAAERHGFAVSLLDGTKTLPFADKSFDIVFCNSVIEHVTGDKDVVRTWTDGALEARAFDGGEDVGERLVHLGGERRMDREHGATEAAAFVRQADGLQAQFAAEIDRVGKAYFVQTPYRHFPVESHTWTPIVLESLPRGVRLRVHRMLRDSRWWPRHVTNVDWRLLTIRDMKRMFPRAEIVTERSFGLVKSLIAVKAR